jgi:hypothetical protein
MAGDALVVVDEVPGAVQDELAPVDLYRPGVVGRMAVHDVHPLVDPQWTE